MKTLVALFDMDGCLVDYDHQLRADLMLIASPGAELNTLVSGKSLWELEELPYIQRRMDLIKSQPGWWKNLPVIEQGLLAVAAARTVGFQIDVLTKGPRSKPLAWSEKAAWCLEHGLTNYHVVSDKTKFAGHVLYDDYVPYLEGWLENNPLGLGIQPQKEGREVCTHERCLQWDGDVQHLVYVLETHYSKLQSL